MRFFLLILLISTCSCVNYTDVYNSISVMEDVVKTIEDNNKIVSDSYLREISSIEGVIESNRNMKIDLINKDYKIPETEEEKKQLINLISEVYTIELEQREKLKLKYEEAKNNIDKNENNFKNYYKISDSVKDSVDVLGSSSPSKVAERYKNE